MVKSHNGKRGAKGAKPFSPERLIDKAGLAQKLGLSVRQINRKIQSGELPAPQPLFLGGRTRYWDLDDLATDLGRRVEELRKIEGLA